MHRIGNYWKHSRGTPVSLHPVEQLIAAIEEYLARYNQSPKKFMWTKDADMILSKIARCKEASVTDTRKYSTPNPSLQFEKLILRSRNPWISSAVSSGFSQRKPWLPPGIWTI